MCTLGLQGLEFMTVPLFPYAAIKLIFIHVYVPVPILF